ncbi:MAG: amino acid ABC transporter permease [Actinomycetota bacterium]|nr:amino acid ABC transporter permease [Actinomycetota bacterium]
MRNLPEDVDRTPVTLADEPVVEVAPEAPPATPWEWVRRNLFSSWFNSLLTIVIGPLVLYVGYRLIRWVFVTADWGVLKANLRLYTVGRFPEEAIEWVWASGFVVVALSGLTVGASALRLSWTRRKTATRVVLAALFIFALIYLVESPTVWALMAAMTVTFFAAAVAGRIGGRRLRLPLAVGWLLSFPLVVVFLRVFGGVPPQLWGGFVLNILLAVVAIFLSFPVGILLALGRRSSFPAIRVVSVGFIELIRGVPLVTLLIFGEFVLPLLLPGVELARIVRAMAMFTIFSSAYVAEIVRGGLQGIPAGQYEAARALGLSTVRMTALIVLPQALRSTIPPMISHFISLFKDTSLIAVLGILDLLSVARRAPSNLEFIGRQKEALLSAALLFWVFAFSMSRWSQRLERRLGVGER